MSDNESVPTSDHVEREEIDAASPHYWESAISTMKQNSAILWAGPFSKDVPPLSRLYHHETMADESPPRKKRKVSYDVPSGHSIEDAIIVSDSKLEIPETRDSSARASPQTGSVSPLVPVSGIDIADETDTVPQPESAMSPLSSASPRIANSASLSLPDHAISPVPPAPPAALLPGVTGDDNILSLTPRHDFSVDPLLLFTPSPNLLSTTLPTSTDEHNAEGRYVQGTPPPLPIEPFSSPLTPMHSPDKHTNPPDSSIHEFRIGNPSPADENLPAGPSRIPEGEFTLSAEYLHEMEKSRYSLRTRNQRQLMPYKYDETLYTRQLRNMPEAIVKMRNIPHRHHREGSHSKDHPQSSDGEVDPRMLEAESSDEDRRRRRSRSAQQRPALEEPPAPVPEERRGPWLPAALRVDFSDDSDLELGVVAQPKQAVTSGSREPVLPKRSKHLKRFPMSAKKYGKQPAIQNDIDDDNAPITSSRTTVFSRRSIQSSEDEMEGVIDRPGSQAVSPDNDAWSVDDPSGLSGLDERPASAPPTSSSIGRLSDIDDRGLATSSSPMPIEPVQLDRSRSPRRAPVPTSREHSPANNENYVDVSLGDASTSSSDEMDAKARKYWKAAKRMMPNVMVLKAFNDSKRPTQRSKRKQLEQTPLAGHVRTKVRGTLGAPIEIKGDSESSESEQSAENGRNRPPLHYEQRTLDVYVGRPRAASLSSSESLSGSEASIHEEVEDDEVSRWNHHPEQWRQSAQDRLKEGSLIDYMLGGTRTRGNATSKRHSGLSTSRGPRLAQGAISVNIGGSRKHNSYRQPRISDHLPSSNGHRPHHNRSHAAPRDRSASFQADTPPGRPCTEHHDIPDAETMQQHKERQKKKKKKKTDQGLYTFDGGGRLTTGRHHADVISIEAEDEQYTAPSRNFIPNFRRKSTSHSRIASSTGLAAPTTPTLDSYFADHPPSPEHIASPPAASPIARRRLRRHIQIDAGIRPLPLGVSFSLDTYLGKGRLKELLDVESSAPPKGSPLEPPPFYINGFTLSHTMSVSDFALKISENIEDMIFQLSNRDGEMTEDEYRSRSRFLYSICVHATWFRSQASEEERSLLVESAGRVLTAAGKLELSSPAAKHDGSLHHRLALDIGWTAIELAARLCADTASQEDIGRLVDKVLTFMEHLWMCGLAETFETVAQAPPTLDYSHINFRLAELWICLIHLCRSWSNTNTSLSFWECLESVMRRCVDFNSPDDNHAVNELMWQTVYIICAFSQFSVSGTTYPPSPSAASWNRVVSSFNLIPHKADPPSQKRDRYLSLLVNRCVCLHADWHWCLEDAQPIFQYLCRAYQSRRYQNLLHEKHSEFPDFLLQVDLHLLYTHSPGDTTFATFLKLIAQSADPTSQRVEAIRDSPPSSSIRKLLAIFIPLGSVNFDKGTPATDKESSMLINRFSAVALGLILIPASFKAYLSQARRYVDFKQMDMKTRRICIRGLMYLTCILRHFDLSLDEALGWLTDMTDILVEEFCQPDFQASTQRHTLSLKDRIAVCIQMLLGTIRRIVERPSMNKGQVVSKYPSPSLLSGAWVTKVFASSTKLVTLRATRQELILLVSAFLDARSTFVPDPPRPRVVQQSADEESQELYAEMDSFNFDDPELAAALGEHDSDPADIPHLESDTCAVLKKDVWPAVNSCVYADIKGLTDSSNRVVDAYWEQATTSISCWVRCASAIVKNDSGDRPWSWFFSSGIPSQDLRQPMRSKLELSYKLAILRWDPSAFNDYADDFVGYLLQALSTYQVTIEHDYASLVIILGASTHPLLAGLLQLCTVYDGDIQLTKADLLNSREAMIDRILSNLDASFGRESAIDYGMRDENRVYLDSVLIMFSTMKDTLSSLDPSATEDYAGFCRIVSKKLAQSHELRDRFRDKSILSWILSMSSPS